MGNVELVELIGRLSFFAMVIPLDIVIVQSNIAASAYIFLVNCSIWRAP